MFFVIGAGAIVTASISAAPGTGLVPVAFAHGLALAVAVSPDAPPIAGFGIGLVVTADILIGGPLTGAAMNPARWFGPAVVSGYLDNWYVYWIGPLLGAALAALTYRYVFAPEAEREPIDL